MSRSSRRSRHLARRLGITLAVAAVIATPAVLVAQSGAGSGSASEQALLAATAWHDWVDGQRAPQVVPPGDTESAIIVLGGDSITDTPEADRAAALTRIQADQLAVEASVQGMGGLVTQRYRTLINGLAVRVPAAHLAGLGEIPGIAAVVPVQYLAPAAATTSEAVPTGDGGQETPPLAPSGGAPAHVALIDTGVDASHPWLGGGIGPNRPIVGGFDLVQADSDPSPDPADPAAEAHGTQIASIILRSPALAGLSPQQVPRLLAYRVTARENVDGQVRTLARSDRVLAALEMAADPNRDGMPDDHADVIALGLARGFGGGGIDPVARALSAANRAGAVVVAPAGNDGPTGLFPGSVGDPASAPGVLTVGGVAGAGGPRTADLSASVGPAGAMLGTLPLMGADPGSAVLEGATLVPASGESGVGTGLDTRDFAGPDGRSTIAGAVAMVTRSGAPIQEVARRAAAAGAIALVVWDESGTGAFPGISGGSAAPIPIVGLGPQQGSALIGLLRQNPSMTVSISPDAVADATPAVASFSSRGPSPTGRLEPDLVAPAVGVEAAFPGIDSGGTPLQAPLSGTSAAAATVVGEALRLRIDHPGWTPADVRSALVQSTGQVPGAGAVDQGAGQAPDAASLPTRALPGVSIDPPIISGPRSRSDDTQMGFTVHDLTGTGGTYRVLQQGDDGAYAPIGGAFDLAPGGRHRGTVTIPRGPESGDGVFRARILVVPDGGQVAAGSAMVWSAPVAPSPKAALGVPTIDAGGAGIGQVTVRVGMRDVRADGLAAVTLHDVSLSLRPVGGGVAIRMTGAEPTGDWPASTYRLALSQRDARGTDVPPGRYRLVVTAGGTGGADLRTVSAPFRVR